MEYFNSLAEKRQNLAAGVDGNVTKNQFHNKIVGNINSINRKLDIVDFFTIGMK